MVPEVCPGDWQLIEYILGDRRGLTPHSLEQHLDRCGVCRRVVAAVAREELPPSHEETAAPPSLPTQLGRYRLLRLMGRGAMGAVYAAHDPNLQRTVALKVMSGAGEDARLLLREAQALARLTHPNVMTVYDAGVDQGEVFLAMELFDGVTLTEWLRASRRSWKSILEVFAAAGQGLSAAHEAGLIHRDFKPDNVLVGADGRVCVSDFGLARRIREATPSGSTTGGLLGTPAYMSPEQLAGRVADARSDQFSFCVSLYEALFGSRPFEGNTLAELRSAFAARPTMPRTGAVPKRLLRLLDRGLALDPAARFSSLEALLGELTPPKQRWPTFAATAVIATALAAIGARSMMEQRSACAAGSARLAGVWDTSTREKVRTSFLATSLPYAGDAFARLEQRLDGLTQTWKERSRQACERASATFSSKEEQLLASSQTACLDRRLEDLREWVSVLQSADRKVVEFTAQAIPPDLATCASLASIRASFGGPPEPEQSAAVKQLRSSISRANAMYAAGKVNAGVEVATAAVKRARALGFRPAEAEALYALAQLQAQSEEPLEAVQSAYQAGWVSEATRQEWLAAQAWTLLSWTLAMDGSRSAEAERAANQTAAAIERLGGSKELQAGLENVLGVVARSTSHHRRAVELAEQVLGPNHPRTLMFTGNLGVSLLSKGEYEGARAVFASVAPRKEAVFGAAHPFVGAALCNLGTTLRHLSDGAGAFEQHQRGLRILEASLPPIHPRIARCRTNLGEDLRLLGRREEALVQLRRALSDFKIAVGSDSPELANILLPIGLLELDRGEVSEAVHTLELALSLREQVKSEALDLGDARFALAKALWVQPAHRARARAMAQNAREVYRTTDAGKRELEQTEAWLASHPRRP